MMWKTLRATLASCASWLSRLLLAAAPVWSYGVLLALLTSPQVWGAYHVYMTRWTSAQRLRSAMTQRYRAARLMALATLTGTTATSKPSKPSKATAWAEAVGRLLLTAGLRVEVVVDHWGACHYTLAPISALDTQPTLETIEESLLASVSGVSVRYRAAHPFTAFIPTPQPPDHWLPLRIPCRRLTAAPTTQPLLSLAQLAPQPACSPGADEDAEGAEGAEGADVSELPTQILARVEVVVVAPAPTATVPAATLPATLPAQAQAQAYAAAAHECPESPISQESLASEEVHEAC